MRKPVQSTRRQWFSRYFGLDSPQYELPFVDFDLKSDVPLYIDPYTITKDPTELAGRCHTAIVSFFQALVDAIRSQNRHEIKRLIHRRLAEPSELHLGVSQIARRGRGIGHEQEDRIIEALIKSEAVRVGAIQAIQEFELHIEGIGPDKVSDLVANIILGELARYTEEACQAHGIPTRPCAVDGFWDTTNKEWTGGHFNLPVKGIHDYILVPKRFIRKDRDLINHREFYEKYVLEILQRELLDARDSLVETLRGGRQRVTKKSVRKDPRFRPSKEFISQFIINHPEVINGYREELNDRFAPADPAEFSGKATIDDPTVRKLLKDLEHIKQGKSQAKKFHSTVFELIQFVFDWCLENFESEYKMNSGRGRVDIIADNFANGGLFLELRQKLNANSVPIECKNYKSDLGNNEFNQIAQRLGEKSSKFGIMFCRQVENWQETLAHLTDRWLRQGIIILLFDDRDLTELVQARLDRDIEKIEGRLRQKRRAVELGGTRR